MTFTDDDLKRLKDAVTQIPGVFSITITTKKGAETFDPRALIARLEAAEVIAKVDARHAPNDPDVLVWRKAAGK